MMLLVKMLWVEFRFREENVHTVCMRSELIRSMMHNKTIHCDFLSPETKLWSTAVLKRGQWNWKEPTNALDENYSKCGQRLTQMCRILQKHLVGHIQSFLIWPYIMLQHTDPIWWLSNSTRLADFFCKLFSMINGLITIVAPPSSSNAHKRDTSIWLEGWKWEERGAVQKIEGDRRWKSRKRDGEWLTKLTT